MPGGQRTAGVPLLTELRGPVMSSPCASPPLACLWEAEEWIIGSQSEHAQSSSVQSISLPGRAEDAEELMCKMVCGLWTMVSGHFRPRIEDCVSVILSDKSQSSSSLVCCSPHHSASEICDDQVSESPDDLIPVAMCPKCCGNHYLGSQDQVGTLCGPRQP